MCSDVRNLLSIRVQYGYGCILFGMLKSKIRLLMLILCGYWRRVRVM